MLESRTSTRFGSVCAFTFFVCLLPGGFCAGAPVLAQPASHRQLEAWRNQIRKTLYIPQPLPKLSVQNYGSFSPAPGVIAERITYGTEYGMRIPAVLYMPEHHANHMPALIVVNGHGGDKYSWYSFYTGILYARAGGVVLTYDPIGEGERNSQRRSGTRAHDKVVDVPGYAQHLSGLMITDVMQGVSYLLQRSDVDPRRIATLGYSMGSFVSAITAAVDTRIHAVVLSGGGDLDGPGGYWDKSSKLMCQAIPWKSLSVIGDRPAVIYALNEERGPTFLINGSADTLVDIPHHLEPYFADLRKRVVAITGTSKNIFDTYFVPNVSHRPNWVTRPAALWLQQELHFPAWTVEQINALPETHISEWAKQNDVSMDKGYIQEDREGGVMALGTGVPNVPRTQLNVLTDEQWQQQQDNLTYEAWVRHTLAHLPAPAAALSSPN
jgi:dienelactone hydrolase